RMVARDRGCASQDLTRTAFSGKVRVHNTALRAEARDFGALANLATGEVAVGTLYNVDDPALVAGTLALGGAGRDPVPARLQLNLVDNTYTIYAGWTYSQAGTYRFIVNAKYADEGGNTGLTASAKGFAKVRNGPTLTPRQRSTDPERGHTL